MQEQVCSAWCRDFDLENILGPLHKLSKGSKGLQDAAAEREACEKSLSTVYAQRLEDSRAAHSLQEAKAIAAEQALNCRSPPHSSEQLQAKSAALSELRRRCDECRQAMQTLDSKLAERQAEIYKARRQIESPGPNPKMALMNEILSVQFTQWDEEARPGAIQICGYFVGGSEGEPQHQFLADIPASIRSGPSRVVENADILWEYCQDWLMQYLPRWRQ